MCVAAKNGEKVIKPLIWGFKVVQGHRCQTVRQQCLLRLAAIYNRSQISA